MSQTLQNQITYAKSMNGIVQLSDGQGTIIQNGTIISNDISGNTITTSNLNTTDLILPRKSTSALISLLGSSIDVDLLIQNLRFSSRTFEIWNDIATGQIFAIDCSNNYTSINSETINLVGGTGGLSFDCASTSFNNSNVSFSNSNVSFNSFLPTSTLTPTTANQLITKTYADSSFAPAGSYALLNSANTFTEQNTFRKGALLCRGTGTNPESDIQLGGNNQLQFRQAASANNISIGQLTLQGSSVTPANNTGSRNIGISHNALQNLTTGTDNVFIGYQAGQNCFGGITQNVAIGNYAMQQCVATSGSVVVGYNSGRNVAASNNVIIGANSGNGITTTGGSVIIGSGHSPTSQDNSVVILGQECAALATGNCLNATILIGYRCGYKLTGSSSYRNVFIGYECGFNSTTGVAACFFMGFNTGYDNTTGSYNTGIGYEALRFNTTGAANCGYGTQSLYFNKTGSNNTAVGTQAGVHTAINLNYTCCLGNTSKAEISNECVLGGETTTDQVFLTLPQKNRINCCQIIGAVATYNIAWRSNENVIVNTATTTTITLPQATDATTIHIGACFNIIRTNASTPTITIQAFGTEKINYSGSVVTSFTIANFIQSISLCCIDNVSGNTLWAVCNYNDRVTTSTNSTNATNATNATITDQTSSLNNYYLNFTSAVTGNQGLNASSNFIFNPSSQLLNLDAGTFQNYKTRSTAFQYFTIPALQTAAFTITNPMYSYYPFTMKTNAGYTVTMPIVEAANVGHQITFKRIGGSLQALTLTMNSNQPIFLSGNAVGTTTSPQTIISATQSSTTIVATQTGDSGTGTFSNTAGSTTVTITAQNSGTLTIGHSVNFNGNVRYITAYGTGLGGTGSYTVSAAIAAANTNQPYTASISYGWAVVSVS